MGQAKEAISLSDYLAIEQKDNRRYEYDNGTLYAMAGGTVNHGIIAGNVFAELRQSLKGKPCTAFNSELKVQLNESKRYVYPDAGVACPRPEESEVLTGAITNPTLIVEVISAGSAAYDMGAKRQEYFRLPSLKAYLIVYQDQPAVSLYRRRGDTRLYSLEDTNDLDATVELPSIGVSLPLREIYADVIFPSPETDKGKA